jgi:hypothetical protein
MPNLYIFATISKKINFTVSLFNKKKHILLGLGCRKKALRGPSSKKYEQHFWGKMIQKVFSPHCSANHEII